MSKKRRFKRFGAPTSCFGALQEALSKGQGGSLKPGDIIIMDNLGSHK